MYPNPDDTIVALSTPAAPGAIGVIRLSGGASIAIVDGLFGSKALEAQASHTAHVGLLRSGGEIIDEVVVTLFKGPHSYTGEDVVEIGCHGSPYIQSKIIEACTAAGARPAAAGEFTQRAFLRGKLDLSQAEAVADLIASDNGGAHRLAMAQMRGGVHTELAALRDGLIHLAALMELELDFGEEDLEFADRSQLQALVKALDARLRKLIASFAYGNAIKNGVPVVIVGKPNAGKSTLLNDLLGEERAIVSEIAGTTRDIVEDAINLEGILFRFIDTAGIRESSDTIEAIGIARAKEKLGKAEVVIHLYEEDHGLLEELEDTLRGKLVFNLVSKTDIHTWPNDRYEQYLRQTYPDYHHFGISIKTGMGLDRLKAVLVAHYKAAPQGQDVVITNARHKDHLEKALAAVAEVARGMNSGLTGDLLTLHIRESLYHLGAITGKIDMDTDILGAIFGKFCIGK